MCGKICILQICFFLSFTCLGLIFRKRLFPDRGRIQWSDLICGNHENFEPWTRRWGSIVQFWLAKGIFEIDPNFEESQQARRNSRCLRARDYAGILNIYVCTYMYNVQKNDAYDLLPCCASHSGRKQSLSLFILISELSVFSHWPLERSWGGNIRIFLESLGSS